MQFDGRASKVMVVDHDRTNLEMLQIRLDVAGFHPIAIRHGREALEMLANTRPDAVILERNLPDIDGMELLRAMAALPGRPAPILLVGRNIAAEDVRAGIELGVRD
ncbi:MAG: response regulator, partial [Phenylobacterium sp.]